jgi:hypothetical protein
VRFAPITAALLAALVSCKAERPTEFVNVSFTVSIDASDYRTWDFDETSCEDFDIEWIDDAALREYVFAAIEEYFDGAGYERVPGGDVDFRIHYEFWTQLEETREETEAQARGSLVIRDGTTGRFVWRATRRAPATGPDPDLDLEARARDFVFEMLAYTTKIRERLEGK